MVQKIRKTTNFESNIFNQYRKRLIERGIIYSKEKGHLAFFLPLFKEFMHYIKDEEDF